MCIRDRYIRSLFFFLSFARTAVGAPSEELLPDGARPRLGLRGFLREAADEGHADAEAGHA